MLQHACLIQSPMSYIPEASRLCTITSVVHAQQSSITTHRENSSLFINPSSRMQVLRLK